MSDFAAIQASIYGRSSKKAKALSDAIINSKLSKREMESIIFIIQMEIMKLKERKEEKKIIRLEEYKNNQLSVDDYLEGPGAGSAAEPPEGADNEK